LQTLIHYFEIFIISYQFYIYFI